MKRLFTFGSAPLLGLALLVGCGDDKTTETSEPGGPGARQANGNGDRDADGDRDRRGTETVDEDLTFNVEVPAAAPNVRQGESETFDISIDRGDDFNQPVTLSFRNLPIGIVLEPASPTIASGTDTVAVTVKAAATAELGEHEFEVVGMPQSGAATPPTTMAVEVVEKE